MFRLLLLFTVVPMVELTLLYEFAQLTSGWTTFALVMVTGAIGASLAKWQGRLAIGNIQAELAEGRLPAVAMFDGLLILIAGVVLVTPGILTDILGFAILLPPVRALLRRLLMRRLRGKFKIQASSMHAGPSSPAPDKVIDVRIIDDRTDE